MADYGFVYCLGNVCMPGIYKVGKTERSVMRRALELSSSISVPEGFHILFYVETDSMSDLVQMAHKELGDFRVNPNREFFECDPRKILEKFEEIYETGDPIATTGMWEELLERLEIEDAFTNRKLKEIGVGQDQDCQA